MTINKMTIRVLQLLIKIMVVDTIQITSINMNSMINMRRKSKKCSNSNSCSIIKNNSNYNNSTVIAINSITSAEIAIKWRMTRCNTKMMMMKIKSNID